MYIYGGRRQGSKLPSAAHQLAVSAGDKHAVPKLAVSSFETLMSRASTALPIQSFVGMTSRIELAASG